MTEPIEICMNLSSHITAKTKENFPTFQFWHAIEKDSGSCASLELYVADQRPPAFVSVNIRCGIPSDSYSKRLISFQTHSVEWHEDDHPGIKMFEDGIGDILKDENYRGNYTPTFAFMKLYSNRNDQSLALQIRFQEIICEFDVTRPENPDYESIAKDALDEIETVHKVLLWVRKLDKEGSED